VDYRLDSPGRSQEWRGNLQVKGKEREEEEIGEEGQKNEGNGKGELASVRRVNGQSGNVKLLMIKSTEIEKIRKERGDHSWKGSVRKLRRKRGVVGRGAVEDRGLAESDQACARRRKGLHRDHRKWRSSVAGCVQNQKPRGRKTVASHQGGGSTKGFKNGYTKGEVAQGGECVEG